MSVYVTILGHVTANTLPSYFPNLMSQQFGLFHYSAIQPLCKYYLLLRIKELCSFYYQVLAYKNAPIVKAKNAMLAG